MNTERPVVPCPKGHEAPIFSATKRCVACTLAEALEAPWPIMTRNVALEAGFRKYWTGNVCANGHMKQRYAASGICIGCNSMNSIKYNKKARKKLAAARNGLVPLNAMVHPDDLPTIQTIIDNMGAARKGVL